jgi:signal transduction histidine kinase
VRVAPEALPQVLTNLLDNAAKYSPTAPRSGWRPAGGEARR